MGQTTPNMGIYIPAAGETNYDASFAAGMINIDQHDHSGAPNKGVPIATSGIADGSVTFEKLNANVVDTTSGLGTLTGPNANKITTTGILNSLATLVTSTGYIAKNGSLVTARTFQGTANQVTVSNGDGASGNTVIGLPITNASTWTPVVNGGGTPQNGTYSVQHGRYIQLGCLVIAIAQVTWTGNAITGDLTVTGFPLSFGAGGTSYISTCAFQNILLPAGTIQVALDGNNADTSANLVGYRDNGASQNVQLGAAGSLYFTLVYFGS